MKRTSRLDQISQHNMMQDQMRRAIRLTVACVFVLVALVGRSEGGVIIQAASAASDTPVHTSFDLNNTINQNNLSIGYTSGATDFDAYIASGPTDGNSPHHMVLFDRRSVPVTVDFDLGGEFLVESFALWNRGFVDQGVRDFKLSASSDASFMDSVDLGDFTATAVIGSWSFTGAEVFSFGPTSASHVRMVVTGYYGGYGVSFNEVAFEARQVPEPTTLAILGIGALGLAGVRRRRRQNRV